MYQSQRQDGKPDGVPILSMIECENDLIRLSMKYDEFITELMKLSKKYVGANNDVQTAAAMAPSRLSLPLPPPPPLIPSKKRVSWTEEEHRLFLRGLTEYGKGKWRRISKYLIPSKTPTQIASHAQKYFLRQASEKKRKSIHDITIQEFDQAMVSHLNDSQNCLPPLPQNWDLLSDDATHEQDMHQPQLGLSPQMDGSVEESQLNSVSLLPQNWDLLSKDATHQQELHQAQLDLSPRMDGLEEESQFINHLNWVSPLHFIYNDIEFI